MPRTPEEEQELQTLLQEENQAQQGQGQIVPLMPQQGQQQTTRTPEEEFELQTLLQEENRAQQQIEQPQQIDQPITIEQIEQRPEAELGVIDRLQFAIDPLQSNRMEFLIKKFGKGNVFKSDGGELFIQQEGKLRPLNEVGFSQADFAELVGAAPEILGTAAANVLGAPVGPAGAAGAGAVAGAAGSAIRQATSALLTEVPQVAEPEERAAEIALSAGLGAVGGVVAQKGGELFKSIFKKISPKKAARAKEVIDISEEADLPKPTTGQMLGGIVERQEKILAQIPFFGRKLREQIQEQSEAVTKKLKKEIGDFSGTDLDAENVGIRIKNVINDSIKARKAAAGELFTDFTERAKDINVDALATRTGMLRRLKSLNLFDTKGKPLKFNPAKTGLPKAEFDRVQKVMEPLLDAFNEAAEAIPGVKRKSISVDAINNLRKSLDGDIKIFQREGIATGVDDVTLLKAREAFMDAVERGIERKDEALSLQFKVARQLWREAKVAERKTLKLGLELGAPNETSSEKVLNKVFSETKNLAKFKELFGKDATEDAALRFIEDSIRATSKGEQVSAAKILSNLRKKSFTLSKSIGRKKFNRLTRLLEFAKENAIPVNPSMTTITEIQSSTIKTLLKGIGLKTILGVVNGTIGLPTATIRGGIQAKGQETKRKAVSGLKSLTERKDK